MRNLLVTCAFGLLSTVAVANPTVESILPNAEKVGSGRLTFMLWDVYDATLYAPNGKWDPNQPYALTLAYLREIDGVDIADRSVEEMRKQGFDNEVKLAVWHSQMRDIFPDVAPGVQLTGIYKPDGTTEFFKDGESIGTINDAEFGKHFFDIWLSKRTSEPGLRKELLGRYATP